MYGWKEEMGGDIHNALCRGRDERHLCCPCLPNHVIEKNGFVYFAYAGLTCREVNEIFILAYA